MTARLQPGGGLDPVLQKLADEVASYEAGPTPLALRACITSHRTQPADVGVLVSELERAIDPE